MDRSVIVPVSPAKGNESHDREEEAEGAAGGTAEAEETAATNQATFHPGCQSGVAKA